MSSTIFLYSPLSVLLHLRDNGSQSTWTYSVSLYLPNYLHPHHTLLFLFLLKIKDMSLLCSNFCSCNYVSSLDFLKNSLYQLTCSFNLFLLLTSSFWDFTSINRYSVPLHLKTTTSIIKETLLAFNFPH